jgi:CheY-like chemotaxis protein
VTHDDDDVDAPQHPVDRALHAGQEAHLAAMDAVVDPEESLRRLRAAVDPVDRTRRGSRSAPEPNPASAVSPHLGARGGKAKILLVDDRPENLLALEAILSALDQTLVRASSGEEALKALLTEDFAVILLDVQMPGMDGFETAAHIKRRERTRDIPIIFITAINHGPHHTFRGYAAGAVDYISKPFDPWALRAKVSVFVDLHKKNVQLREQAALLRRDLGGPAEATERGGGLLPELSARLAAVEEQAEALIKELETSGDGPAASTAAQLERRLARLRRTLDALRSASEQRSESDVPRSTTGVRSRE